MGQSPGVKSEAQYQGAITALRSAQWLKPLRSASIVSIGKAMQAVMSLAFVALAARALGMEAFGMLALIHGLVFGLSQIIRFQTWQAVVRYGAQALQTNDTDRLQRLVKFTTMLDVIAAITGLTLIMVVIVPAGDLFKVPPDLHDEIRLYGISILVMVMASTPLGVLRLLDRFDLIAIQTTIAPAIRLAGTLYLFLTGGGLVGFLAVWFAAAVVSRITLLAMAWGQLGKEGLLENIGKRHESQLMPEVGIWRFVLAQNLSRGLFLSQAQMGLLMAGGLLGPAAAGVFRIAQRFSDILIRSATKILMPAIYPELAKLQASQDHDLRRSMILRTALLAGGIAATVLIILTVSGKTMITSFVGADYAAAYIPMLWLALAGLITVVAFPLEPLLSSTGRVKHIVMAQFLATIFYLVLILVLAKPYGLTGVSMATLGAVLSSTFILALSGRDLILGRPS
jgi:O-antigen/teichoic acid export membrane protein